VTAYTATTPVSVLFILQITVHVSILAATV